MPEFEQEKKSAKSTEEVSQTTPQATENPEMIDSRADASDQAELISLEAASHAEDDDQELEREKEELTKAEINKEMGKAALTAHEIKSTVDAIDKASDPETADDSVFTKTEKLSKNVLKSTAFKVFGTVLSIGTAIKDMASGIANARAKKSQKKAYHEVINKDIDRGKGEGVLQEAIYALTKIGKGFYREVYTAINGFFKFVENIFILFTGPTAIIGGLMKIIRGIIGILFSIYKGGKKIYQYFKGQKKVSNSKSVLKKAINGDQEALQLIVDLNLSYVSGYKKFKFLDAYRILEDKDKKKFCKKMNLQETNAESSMKELDDEAPENNLHERFTTMKVFDSKSSKKSFTDIQQEIQETMTGLGT